MMVPVRCFSCGFPIGEYYEKYMDLVSKGKTPKEALDILEIDRYCCRRHFLTTKEYVDDLNMYYK